MSDTRQPDLGIAAPEILHGVQPVREIPPDNGKAPDDTIGLCLSGGGYRAMLFHLGALLRINEAGLLRRLARVSSVSGGSITAAALALKWSELTWLDGVATNLRDLVVAPVRELAHHTVDVWAVVEGAALPFTSIADHVAHAYREHLFGEADLQQLPADDEGPRFVICATNLESGALFRFSRPYVADWRVGTVRDARIPIADAVAASSAFPPVLSPFDLDLRSASWETVDGNDMTGPDARGVISLSDGGVYDNLGLETVWKRCRSVLISDGGGHMPDDPDPPHAWPTHTLRVLSVIDNQVRDLRKRQAIGSYGMGLRAGAYWGIRSDVADYGLADALDCPPHQTRALAQTPTRLKKLDDDLQQRLINWGFAICDTALRRWVKPDLEPPQTLPYPSAGLG